MPPTQVMANIAYLCARPVSADDPSCGRGTAATPTIQGVAAAAPRPVSSRGAAATRSKLRAGPGRVDEVEHGCAVEPDVVRVEAMLGHAAQRVQDHVPLGQHDALRAARRAGRVVHLRARVVGRRDRVAGPRRWGAAAGREGLVGRSVLVPRRARPDDDADAADGARARHGFGEAARRDEDLAGGVCEAVCELVGG